MPSCFSANNMMKLYKVELNLSLPFEEVIASDYQSILFTCFVGTASEFVTNVLKSVTEF